MSGHGGHGGGSEVTKVIFIFIAVMCLLFVAWYYTGGPERANTANPFQKPLAPIDTGETYGPNTVTN